MALVTAHGIDTSVVAGQPDWTARRAAIDKLACILFALKQNVAAMSSTWVAQIIQRRHHGESYVFGKQPVSPSPYVVFELLLSHELAPGIPQESVS